VGLARGVDGVDDERVRARGFRSAGNRGAGGEGVDTGPQLADLVLAPGRGVLATRAVGEVGDDGGELAVVVDAGALALDHEPRVAVGLDGVGGEEEDLLVVRGADARGHGVEGLDVVGAVRLGFDRDRRGAPVLGVAQEEEQVVQVVGHRVVGRAVEDPGAARVAEAARPVVAGIVGVVAGPQREALRAQRAAEEPGSQVALQGEDGLGERPLEADRHPAVVLAARLDHPIDLGHRRRSGLLAQDVAALFQGEARQLAVRVDQRGDDRQPALDRIRTSTPGMKSF